MRPGIDYTGVSVVYYCHDGQGRVLMSLRGQGSRDERGVWDIGGGRIEFGETIENTLRREVAEEYCWAVCEREFLGYRDVRRREGEGRTHWVALDFLVRIDAQSARNGEPHKFDEVRWFPHGAFPEKLHSQFPRFWDAYGHLIQSKM